MSLRRFTRTIKHNDTANLRKTVAKELMVYGKALDPVVTSMDEAVARVQVEGNIHAAIIAARKAKGDGSAVSDELMASLERAKHLLNSNTIEQLIRDYEIGDW